MTDRSRRCPYCGVVEVREETLLDEAGELRIRRICNRCSMLLNEAPPPPCNVRGRPGASAGGEQEEEVGGVS